MTEDLAEEARLATELLVGKVVERVWRHRSNELVVAFNDGSKMLVDHRHDGLELSIT